MISLTKHDAICVLDDLQQTKRIIDIARTKHGQIEFEHTIADMLRRYAKAAALTFAASLPMRGSSRAATRCSETHCRPRAPRLSSETR